MPGGKYRSLNNTSGEVPIARGAYEKLPVGARPKRKGTKTTLLWGHVFQAKSLTRLGGYPVRPGEFVEPTQIVGFDATPVTEA